MDKTNFIDFCNKYLEFTNNPKDKVKNEDIKKYYTIFNTNTNDLVNFYKFLENKIIENKNQICYGLTLKNINSPIIEEFENICNLYFIFEIKNDKISRLNIKNHFKINYKGKIIFDKFLSYIIEKKNVIYNNKYYSNIELLEDKPKEIEIKIKKDKNFDHYENFCNIYLEFTTDKSMRLTTNELKNLYINYNNNSSSGIAKLYEHLYNYKDVTMISKKYAGLFIKTSKNIISDKPIKTLSTSKKCIVKGCDNTQPVYNIPEKPIGEYCNDCRTYDMINVVNKKCEYEGCKSQPSFNYPDEKPKFCKQHVEKGMINVKDLLCKCGKYASFNKPGLKPEFCKTCSEDGMYNIKANRCIGINCNTIPSYNYPGEYARYCEKCADKDNGMINVISKRCKFEDCDIIPNYGIKGETAEYCETHSLEGMIDVCHKMCFTCGKVRASFNEKGLKPMFCNTCKSFDMKNLVDKKCNGCNNLIASFNYDGLPPKYCKTCSLITMTDTHHKKCIECKIIRADKKYDNHCFNCYYIKFPTEKIIRNFKVKENRIVLDLKNIFPDLLQDKIIHGGTSKRRPDILIQLDNYNIIIEIDEKQHKTYELDDDNIRIMDIYNDLNKNPLTVIRFNPDKYKNSNKENIKSIFQLVKKNIAVIEEKYQERFKILIKTINDNMKPDLTRKINTIKLFYDGF